jgi:CelD/BcsL family acetyltransferase involved in cellulose biosynthesis
VIAPLLTLPDSFDAYLASLAKRDRHELRRKLRRAEGVDGLRWYVVDGEFASELEPEVEAFLNLMARSRPDKADFMTPRMRRFFHAGVRAAHRGGWLQLAFLEIEGYKAATYLNFDYGDQLLVYNSGYEPEAVSGFSPGIVLIARLIEQAIRQGKRAVDFMRGAEEYKYRLGAKDVWVHHLTVERRGH